MLKIIKIITKQIFCKHEYELLADLSYRKVETNRRYHHITIICSKCHKEKLLKLFSTSDKFSFN